MRIGIIGSGTVGRTLGSALVARGHDVTIGSRDPAKLDDWVAGAGARASAGTFAQAASHGELVILATLWEGTRSALELCGAGALAGKVVIDATNPLDFSRGMPPRLAPTADGSGGEAVAGWLEGARVVKALNTVGAHIMVDPQGVTGDDPTMFIAGDDDDAKAVVRGLLAELGWTDVVDLGGLFNAAYLEALAMVWITVWARTQAMGHALKLVGRPAG